MRIAALSPATNPTARGVVPIRVLVIDDEPLIQWSVCTALAAAGFDAIAVRGAEEARRCAAEWPPPKVVVLDIHPDGGGRELMTDIRTIYPDCRFLVMSTTGRSGDAWPSTNGVQTVKKPFDLAEVVRLVNRAVQQGPLQSA